MKYRIYCLLSDLGYWKRRLEWKLYVYRTALECYN